MVSNLAPQAHVPITPNPAHADLPPLTTSPGGVTSIQPGSQDAITYNKKKYANSSDIKFRYLTDHSYLGQYIIRYCGQELRIGMMDNASGPEHFAYYHAATGKYMASFGGLDDLAGYLTGQPCRKTWKDFKVIRSGIDVGSMQDFRHNWAKANARLKENANSSDEDSSGAKEEGEIVD
jgi:hypothetical protein